jgi:hypothetical protein
MTMLSFRVDEATSDAVGRWADLLGISRSELLRTALHRHLARLRAEHDLDRWARLPLTDDEQALAEIADWGPAEDWSDWADATR